MFTKKNICKEAFFGEIKNEEMMEYLLVKAMIPKCRKMIQFYIETKDYTMLNHITKEYQMLNELLANMDLFLNISKTSEFQKTFAENK